MDAALFFLNPAEARTLDTLAACIIPGDAADPGAREAGVVTYVDRTLAGYLREYQSFYRQGIRTLDQHCIERHGRVFADLDTASQTSVIEELDQFALTGNHPLGQFFLVVRRHVVEGFFCDPAYGGNRGTVGWKMIGFPGAHWGYTEKQMERSFDPRQLPTLTLADLYARQEDES